VYALHLFKYFLWGRCQRAAATGLHRWYREHALPSAAPSPSDAAIPLSGGSPFCSRFVT
jgi:hypothetical protein